MVLIVLAVYFVGSAIPVSAAVEQEPIDCSVWCSSSEAQGGPYDLSRSIGANKCSCCKKIDEGKYDCLCQGSNLNKDCRVGGLVTDPICACCGDCTLTNAVGVGITIANIILKYLGVIALLLFVYGGIIWMTSGGASEKIQQGKKIVLGAVIGIVIICFAYVIVQTLLKALNVEKIDEKDIMPKGKTQINLIISQQQNYFKF